MRLSLSEWESFYVITGSSAAALTGLMFVVVALAAERIQRQQSDGVGAFSTPTVAHFSIVLLIASLMSVPGHSVVSLSLCIGGCAAVGLTSSGRAGLRMKKVAGYTPETEDWAFHVILPLASYGVLLVSAFLIGTAQELALIMVAIGVLALIFIGIHNAWDVAVFLVTQHAPIGSASAVTTVTPAAKPESIAAPAAAQSDGSGSFGPG